MKIETPAGGSAPARVITLHRLFAAALFLLLLSAAVAQALYVFTEVRRIAWESSVMTAASIADRFVRSLALEPHGAVPAAMFEAGVLRKASLEFAETMPGADLFLVSESGQILANFSEHNTIRQKIDPAPLHEFLRVPRSTGPLVFGDDPTSPTGTTPFVSIRVPGFERPTLLYVALQRTFLLRSLRFKFDEYLPKLILVTLAAQIATAILAAFLIRRFLTRRLRLLSQALESYRRGKYSDRVEVKGSDEVAELASLANSMADKIETSISALEDRDRLRRELIANVSHDLRTPASVLQGYSSLLVDPSRELTHEDRKGVYSAIASGSLSLSRLLAQLWELSRLEAKERVPELETFCVGELATEVADQLREKARTRDIEIVITIPEPPPAVVADPSLIIRALTNLIENAIHYTPSGGRVEIEVVPEAGGVSVRVHDTGAGISEEDLTRIFERTVRVKGAETGQEDSGGLGLAIVRRIMELHGIEISVSSKEAEGSTFGFALPRA